MIAKPGSLTQNILEHARGLPRGFPLLAEGFLHLGKRAAINRALSRLARREELYRIGHGIYVLPVISRWGKSAPFPYPTVIALAEQRGDRIVDNPAQAAYNLDVSTQVPMREIYLTSGPSRRLHFGKLEVELRHAPKWQLALGETPAGMAIRTIHYFGPRMTEYAAKKLRGVLDDKVREELAGISVRMPSWVAGVVKEIAHV